MLYLKYISEKCTTLQNTYTLAHWFDNPILKITLLSEPFSLVSFLIHNLYKGTLASWFKYIAKLNIKNTRWSGAA
jgi:hypothetical protein